MTGTPHRPDHIRAAAEKWRRPGRTRAAAENGVAQAAPAPLPKTASPGPLRNTIATTVASSRSSSFQAMETFQAMKTSQAMETFPNCQLGVEPFSL